MPTLWNGAQCLIEGEPLPVLPWFNGKDYGYDANGNLTYDRDRNITAIAYNAVDRPRSVRFAGGDVTRYVYSATGERLAEVHASRDGLSDVRRMRLGAFSFTDGRLERTELPQGYLDTLGTLHVYIPDFQGNIVGVYRDGGVLEQFTDYYPYGTPHPDARHPEANRRKYGGKELLTEGGLNEHDFEARRLTPLGSFSQPDPLAGTLTDPETGDRLPVPYLCHISPYAYCAADPINSIDPTGMYILENMDDKTTILVVAVFPDTENAVNEMSNEEIAIYHDYQAAKEAGVPIIKVKDVADFKNAMTEISGKLFSPETIVFNSHGASGEFYIGNEAVNSASDLSRLNKELNGKTVVVSACDVGIDQSGSRGDIFTEVLAEQTNSTVITSLHKVPVGSKYDGGTLNNRDLSSPDFNAYRISYRGADSNIITDVSVHKTIGVRWKSNPFGVFSNIFPK